MKTNSTQVKQAVQAYILNAIDFTNYDQENTLENLAAAFKSEAGPVRRNQNYQDHFIDFIQGLPSWFNVDYYDDDILNVMVNQWGLPQPSNKTIKDSVNLFYYLIYRELTNLLKKANLSLYN